MNPTSNEHSMLNLPPPVAEQPAATPVAAPEAVPGMPAPAEQAPATPEQAPVAATPAPTATTPPPTDPATAAPVANTPQTTATTTTVDTPDVADDGDLIEKEWVTKAKQIVERTHDDPYKQSNELTAMRADYMQKRYNKTIKLSE